MNSILSQIMSLLDSNEIDTAREEIEKFSLNLHKIDITVREFANLLALGSQQALEIALGVLGRKLLNHETEISQEVLWLLLASILSRKDITIDSPSRISILGLTDKVEDWKSPIFALLIPALDTFFQNSLKSENVLIAEQTLDFLATEGNKYGQTFHIKTQLGYLKNLCYSLLEEVDDLELQEDWKEGIDDFYQIGSNKKTFDNNVLTAGKDLLETIYDNQILNHDETSNFIDVKNNILKLITSCLAALGIMFENEGLSLAVRIDSTEKDNLWLRSANAIDEIQTLFQEVADSIFERLKLPTFTPPEAIPGSWTMISHVNLTSDKANELAKAIASLSSLELTDENNRDLVNSWQNCVAKLKKNHLKVDLAVSSNQPESIFSYAISTEDISIIEDTSQSYNRVFSGDVPQADNLDHILLLASLLIEHSSNIKEVFLERTNMTERQFSYYRKAAIILQLATERDQPTNDCYILNRLENKEAQMRFLAYRFMSSNVGLAWFKWQNARDLSQLQPERVSDFLREVCHSLSTKTIERRSVTLKKWLNTFLIYWYNHPNHCFDKPSSNSL